MSGRNPVLPLGFLVGLLVACEPSEVPPAPHPSGPYLDQSPPGLTPEIFAPGLFSTGRVEWSPTFTPDGRELFYTLQGPNEYHLVNIREQDGGWLEPTLVPFTSGFSDADPYLSPDGNTLFFWSNRPTAPGSGPKADADLWMVSRDGEGWGLPQHLSEEINTDTWQVFPSVSSDGTLYFAAYYEWGLGHFDLWQSEWTGDGYGPPVNLGPALNSEFLDQEPAISPDGSTLVFVSARDGREDWDLYVSFRDTAGEWTDAVSLGDLFNTEAMEQAPVFSADGRFLFFSSDRRLNVEAAGETPLTYRSAVDALNGPGNGSSDAYWVDAAVLEQFHPSGG